MPFLLHVGLEGITEVDTDPKGRFVFFKGKLPLMRVFCLCPFSVQHQRTAGRFFEGLQNQIQNKNEGNENKIMLGDFNCTLDKRDRGGENKTQRI